MIRLRRPWHHRAADQRVAAATAERAESERRLAEVREHVITPLREAAERNNFAELIRANLLAGHGHVNGPRGRGSR